MLIIQKLPNRKDHYNFLNKIPGTEGKLQDGRTVKDWVKYGFNQCREEIKATAVEVDVDKLTEIIYTAINMNNKENNPDYRVTHPYSEDCNCLHCSQANYIGRNSYKLLNKSNTNTG